MGDCFMLSTARPGAFELKGGYAAGNPPAMRRNHGKIQKGAIQ
jgi:hypothetical protein